VSELSNLTHTQEVLQIVTCLMVFWSRFADRPSSAPSDRVFWSDVSENCGVPFTVGSTTHRAVSGIRGTVWGTRAKPLAAYHRRLCCLCCPRWKIKLEPRHIFGVPICAGSFEPASHDQLLGPGTALGPFSFRANVVATQDAGEKTVSVMAVTKLS